MVAKTNFSQIVTLTCVGLSLGACSYMARADVSGKLGDTPMRGDISYRFSGHDDGVLNISDGKKLACAAFLVGGEQSVRFFGSSLADRTFEGRMACSDGRIGRFTLISPKPDADGLTGTLTGKLGDQSLTLNAMPALPCPGGNCGQWPMNNEAQRIALMRASDLWKASDRPN
jgi:hypothetical protein